MITSRRSFLKHASLAPFSLWIPQAFSEATTTALARSTPEAQGVAAAGILDFLDALEREKGGVKSVL